MNVDNRKGELADIKNQLRLLAGSQSPGVAETKKEIFKKVISYMTVGIDVSSLFSEMIMCTTTPDVVLKKMCYLYISNYAQQNPDLALLTINFLQRDCRDDDPTVRGLALRSLCSLRLRNLVEYLLGPLEKALTDPSAYVRKTAVMGVLKLFHLAPALVEGAGFGFISALETLLVTDRDPQVIVNCICALQEITAVVSSCRDLVDNEAQAAAASDDEDGDGESGNPAGWGGADGGNASSKVAAFRKALLGNAPLMDAVSHAVQLLTSKHFVYRLLNRLLEFSEWGQSIVLELLSGYVPESEDEVFDIMNVLEDRMAHVNSGVVLATVKIFLNLTLSMPLVHQQVYERAVSPLITLISGSACAEVSYAVLAHVYVLVQRAPMLFSGHYKHFYCRYSDPGYTKKLKLEILTAIADRTNTVDIVSELSEYVTDVDVPIARASIRSIGAISLRNEELSGIILERLLAFLDIARDYISAEAVVTLRDILRKYPDRAPFCIAAISELPVESITEPEAKAALVWMIAEFGHELEDAPYKLEPLLQGYADEASPAVRLELLAAAAKLFFKRPAECQRMLGAVLVLGCADLHQHVHDRALLYYRLLKVGADAASAVICAPKDAVTEFADGMNEEVKEKIFEEFNSFSVVFRQPSHQFVVDRERSLLHGHRAGEGGDSDSDTSPQHKSSQRAGTADLPESGLLSAAERDELHHGDSAHESEDGSRGHSSRGGGGAAPAPAPPDAMADLLGLGVAPPPAHAAVNGDGLLLGLDVLAPPPLRAPVLKLMVKPTLDAGLFQKKWSSLPLGVAEERDIPALALLSNRAQSVIRHMATAHVQCMASGGQAPNLKFYFYAQRDDAAQPAYFFAELITSGTKASLKVKAEDTGFVEAFRDLFFEQLATTA